MLNHPLVYRLHIRRISGHSAFFILDIITLLITMPDTPGTKRKQQASRTIEEKLDAVTRVRRGESQVGVQVSFCLVFFSL